MTIKLSELHKYQPLQKVIVHSLETALYQASVMIDVTEHYIKEDNGEFMRGLSPLHIQKRLIHLNYEQMVLRHTSAYDEMCGQPQKLASNMLEVPYGKNNVL